MSSMQNLMAIVRTTVALVVIGRTPVVAEQSGVPQPSLRPLAKMDLPLETKEFSTRPKDKHQIAVSGDLDRIKGLVEKLGGRVIVRTPTVLTANVTGEAILNLLSDPDVDRIAMGRRIVFQRSLPSPQASKLPGFVKPNHPVTERRSAHYDEQFQKVLKGSSPFSKALTGRGVLLAVIEGTVPDFRHPDFRDDDGNTRFHAIWDMTEIGKGPQNFGYGKVMTREEINAALRNPRSGLFFGGQASHVTQSLGVAAGNGALKGEYVGVAPNVQLMAINVSHSQVSIIDAAAFAFQEADRLGMPCVVSISTAYEQLQGQPEDGESLVTRALSDLVEEKPGRIICASAGNQGNIKSHVFVNVKQATECRECWFSPIASNFARQCLSLHCVDRSAFEIQIETADLRSSGAKGDRTAWMSVEDLLKSDPQEYSLTAGADSKSKVVLQVIPKQRGPGNALVWLRAKQVAGGTAYLALVVKCRGSGVMEGWGSFSLSPVQPDHFPNIDFPTSFVEPDSLRSVIAPANGRSVAAAGAYHRGGEVAHYSQPGGQYPSGWKPNILVPVGIPAAIPLDAVTKPGDEPYSEYAGTSCAAPVLAGVAALFLENNPQATAAMFLDRLQSTALEDRHTLHIPNPKSGCGKIDLAKLLAE